MPNMNFIEPSSQSKRNEEMSYSIAEEPENPINIGDSNLAGINKVNIVGLT